MANNTLMPAIFVGHGSPMNVLLKNSYTKALNELALRLPKPKAILAISAHWETSSPSLLNVAQPRIIYDFGGFPPELSKIQYPAPGAPELASAIQKQNPKFTLTNEWGLDHGVWAVLHFLYPHADIPVLPLSLGKRMDLREHLELAKSLAYLRKEGVLILGSGNITHNLGDLDWDNPEAAAFPWANDFDLSIKQAIDTADDEYLIAIKNNSLWSRAHPRREHYLPLLYVAGVRHEREVPNYFLESFQHGSLSMRSFYFAPT